MVHESSVSSANAISPGNNAHTNGITQSIQLLKTVIAGTAQAIAALSRLSMTKDYYLGEGKYSDSIYKASEKAIASGQINKFTKHAQFTSVLVAGIIHGMRNSEDLKNDQHLIPVIFESLKAELGEFLGTDFTKEFKTAVAAAEKKAKAFDNATSIEEALSKMPSDKTAAVNDFVVRRWATKEAPSVVEWTDWVEHSVNASQAVVAKHLFEVGRSIGDKLSKTLRCIPGAKTVFDTSAVHFLTSSVNSGLYILGVALENLDKVTKAPFNATKLITSAMLDGAIESLTTNSEVSDALESVELPQSSILETLTAIYQDTKRVFEEAYGVANLSASSLDKKFEKSGIRSVVETNINKSKRVAEYTMRISSFEKVKQGVDQLQFILSATGRTGIYLGYKALKLSGKYMLKAVLNAGSYLKDKALNGVLAIDIPKSIPILDNKNKKFIITKEHKVLYKKYKTGLDPDIKPPTLEEFAKREILITEYAKLKDSEKFFSLEEFVSHNITNIKVSINATIKDMEEYTKLKRNGHKQAQQSFKNYFIQKCLQEGITDQTCINHDFGSSGFDIKKNQEMQSNQTKKQAHKRNNIPARAAKDATEATKKIQRYVLSIDSSSVLPTHNHKSSSKKKLSKKR